jgi:GrpB-like predicted nucleotidyltransferase (UPF0157 family)
MGFTTPGCRAGLCTWQRARPHHLHVVQASTLPTRNQLLLREYLRGHPNDAGRYGALKRRLAALHDNGDDYTRAKTELIQELTDKAGRAV